MKGKERVEKYEGREIEREIQRRIVISCVCVCVLAFLGVRV